MVLKKKAKRERERNPSGRLNLLSTKHCPLWACVFLLAFFPFLACILEVTPLLQACTCNDKENKASKQAKKITKTKGSTQNDKQGKESTQNDKQGKESTQRGKQACYQAKEGVLERQM